jgi:hypothetical protein
VSLTHAQVVCAVDALAARVALGPDDALLAVMTEKMSAMDLLSGFAAALDPRAVARGSIIGSVTLRLSCKPCRRA